jgi:hypothetical protein
MSGIYQVWSVFAITRTIIAKLLQNDYQPLDPYRLFYEAKKNFFHFDLIGNVTKIILTKGTTRVEIKYEPRYRYHEEIGNTSGLVANQTHLGLTPDMAVEVYKKGDIKHFIVFDAKDRSNTQGKDKKFLREDKESLWKYVNGISYKQSYPSGQRLVPIPTIACILYSGTFPDWAPSNPPSSNIRGALPLTPNMHPDVTKSVDQAIDDILSIAGLIM